MTKSSKIIGSIFGSLFATSGITAIALVRSSGLKDNLEVPKVTSLRTGSPVNFEKFEGLKDEDYWKWNFYYLKELESRNHVSKENLGEDWAAFKGWCQNVLLSEKNHESLEDVYNEFMTDDSSVCFASRNIVDSAPWKDKDDEGIKSEIKNKIEELRKK